MADKTFSGLTSEFNVEEDRDSILMTETLIAAKKYWVASAKQHIFLKILVISLLLKPIMT